MEKITRTLALLMSFYLLYYDLKAFQAGRVTIKGVTYHMDQPIAFAFSIALIAAFALMVLGLLLAPRLMLSPLALPGIYLEGSMAAGLKVIITIGVIFGVCLKLTYARLRS